MRYIKYFESSKSDLSSLKRESDDIFLPLRTEGYFIIGTGNIMGGGFNIWITKTRDGDTFEYSDIESYLEHFLNYAESVGYVINSIEIIRNSFDSHYIKLDDLHELNNYDSLFSITIQLKNDIQKNERNFTYMKYLKTYELFGLFKKKEHIKSNVLLNYKDEISDIFLDLTDKGLYVNVIIYERSKGDNGEIIDHYSISIRSSNSKYFLYTDVVDSLKFGLAYIKYNIGLVPHGYHFHFYKRNNHMENWGVTYDKFKDFDKSLLKNDND